MDLLEGVLSGKIRAIARTISLIENDDPLKEEIIDELFKHTNKAMLLGITGPPGAGKSTLADKLIEREREKKRKVAVIAIDPSSPFSGGALLGDRLRMQKHSADPGVFIRSMASRGYLGGVARSTADVIKVLDAAGYDTIIIETMGVGHSEVEIIELSDMVLLVLAPGMGDEIQAMKAGIMEIGDIFVINKKDKDGAEKLKAEVDYALSIKYPDNMNDKNPIVMVSAAQNDGIDELMEAIYKYFEKIEKNGLLLQRRKKRIALELRKVFARKLHDALDLHIEFKQNIEEWVEMIYGREVKPYALINEKMNKFIKERRGL